ncbi:Uncharacterized conserved protein, DUF924 family [Roseovarius nanhaiticus]|uniref:Uncharacterized conserved protein, DUF924 family n=1 Tax=Roseovarius nanhaiticus TaxID=573024 RepID=A0A1N7G6C1_9RHOB|nr:DUF924 family protein [Roseovarius nanhaiticus]SEK36108.1 Uncharacterized conserved protein, DUF924 family [Roseovarius nanhaiticus]SIS08054.1 Uncharacterized conserved protein, DUF924 family [Roseovarius nanhaiticus]
MTTPDDVLTFWLDEVGPKGWYAPTDELDATITERFADAWQSARNGTYGLWLTYPTGALAYIILMDQLPRNMHRGQGAAFATDRHGVAAAKAAIGRKWDMTIDEPARQFFYLPLMHSENLCDQERCIRLICERMPETGADNLLHARAHREVIRQFGRFPYRNDALGRKTTPAEAVFLKEGGYGHTLRQLQQKDAA